MKCALLDKNKIKQLNSKLWHCLDCNTFPHQDLDTDDFLQLTQFNSLIKTVTKTTNSFDQFTRIPQLNISKPNCEPFTEFSDSEENISTLDLNYYNLHDFHKLKNKISNQSLSISY